MLIFSSKIEKPELLEDLLIGRKDIVDSIERSVIQAITNNQSIQHLLIGARGSGKTHLIHVLFNRFSNNENLKEKLVIAYMAEEEIGIDSLFSLIIRIFEAFIRWGNDIEEKSIWNEKINSLKGLKHHEREDKAKEYLLDHLKNKTLLLLIENINDVFNGMKISGQARLRDFIQQYEKINIISTSQVLFPDIQNEDRPFHNFFQITHLKHLSEEESKLLLMAFSKAEGSSELENHFHTNQGISQMKSIHFLSGGNHRLIALFFEFLKNDIKSDMAEPFLKTLDKLKPYYESFIRYLPPQQQKIVHFLAIKHEPQYGATIAKECFLTPGGASKQINELQNKGFIESINIGRANKYELTEPMMRFCIELTENRDGIIGLLARFITVLYSDTEIINKYLRLKYLPTYYCQDGNQKRSQYEEVLIYEKAGGDNKNLLIRFENFIQKIENVSAKEALIKITMLARDRYINCPYVEESCSCSIILNKEVTEDKTWKIFLSELLEYSLHKEAFALLKQILSTYDKKDEYLTLPVLFVSALIKLKFEKEIIKDYALNMLKLSLDDLNRKFISTIIDFEIDGDKKAIYRLTKEERAILAHIQENISPYRYPSNMLEIRTEKNKIKKELLYKEAIESYPNESFLIVSYADFLGHIGKIEEADELYSQALKFNPNEPEILDDYGNFLLKVKKDIESAKLYFQKTLQLNPKSEYYWTQYTDLLEDYEENYPEAEKSYKKMIKIFPRSSRILLNYGIFQFYHGDINKALEYLSESIKYDAKNGCAIYYLGRVSHHMGKYAEALDYYAESLKTNPKNITPYFDRGLLNIELGEFNKSNKDFLKIVNSLPVNSISDGLKENHYLICVSITYLALTGIISQKNSTIIKAIKTLRSWDLSTEMHITLLILDYIQKIISSDKKIQIKDFMQEISSIKAKDYFIDLGFFKAWLSTSHPLLEPDKKTQLVTLFKKLDNQINKSKINKSNS